LTSSPCPLLPGEKGVTKYSLFFKPLSRKAGGWGEVLKSRNELKPLLSKKMLILG